MRRILMTALATAAIGFGVAAPAEAAATLQLCTSGASCVGGTTNVNLGTFDAPGNATVTGNVGVGGPIVDFYTGDGTLLQTNTGAATIFTASGADLTTLTFQLMTGAFTAAEFNLEQGTPRTFDVTLSAVGGGSQVIHVDNSSGANIFDIIAGTGESYTTATFSSTNGSFKDFKQLRLVLAPGSVPEPATWAMMLLGFGGIGMAMRRRRRSQALMQIA
jgi:hypothetical protein